MINCTRSPRGQRKDLAKRMATTILFNCFTVGGLLIAGDLNQKLIDWPSKLRDSIEGSIRHWTRAVKRII